MARRYDQEVWPGGMTGLRVIRPTGSRHIPVGQVTQLGGGGGGEGHCLFKGSYPLQNYHHCFSRLSTVEFTKTAPSTSTILN